MLVKEFIKECEKKLDPEAEMDFLLLGLQEGRSASGWLELISVSMNDDPAYLDHGGLVFVKKSAEEFFNRKQIIKRIIKEQEESDVCESGMA